MYFSFQRRLAGKAHHQQRKAVPVHQVHGVGLTILLVGVLGFVEHGGVPIFGETRGVVNFNETPNQVLNALENVVVALAEVLGDLAAGCHRFAVLGR